MRICFLTVSYQPCYLWAVVLTLRAHQNQWKGLLKHGSLGPTSRVLGSPGVERKVKVKVIQLSPAVWDPMVYTVHGILQARILEWVAVPFSRGSSQPRDWTQVSHIVGRFFTSWATREALRCGVRLKNSISDKFQGYIDINDPEITVWESHPASII